MPNARILVINSVRDAAKHITAIGASEGKIEWLASKANFFAIKFENLAINDAIMVKNDMLEMGGNAAYNTGVYDHSVDRTDMIIAGTVREYERLAKRLKLRNPSTIRIAERIEYLINAESNKRSMFMCKEKRVPIGRKTIVMGVVNVNNDISHKDALTVIEDIISEGADIIDICATPRADKEEYKKNIVPLVNYVSKNYKIPICVDTWSSEIADSLLYEGAHIINDIWGAQKDLKLGKIIASYKAGIVLMHSSKKEYYEDIMSDIVGYLRKGINICQSSGIGISNIVVDPGVGFGKNTMQSLKIISKLKELKSIGVPIMIGTSRKDMIGEILDLPSEDRLEGTAASVAVSIMNGADIIRVHDVREMTRVALVTDAISKKV